MVPDGSWGESGVLKRPSRPASPKGAPGLRGCAAPRRSSCCCCGRVLRGAGGAACARPAQERQGSGVLGQACPTGAGTDVEFNICPLVALSRPLALKRLSSEARSGGAGCAGELHEQGSGCQGALTPALALLRMQSCTQDLGQLCSCRYYRTRRAVQVS